MSILVTGERGLGMAYLSFKNVSWKEFITMHPDLIELKYTCLCSKFRCKKDMDKDYESPKSKSYCNVCKESLEWRLKE